MQLYFYDTLILTKKLIIGIQIYTNFPNGEEDEKKDHKKRTTADEKILEFKSRP